MTQTKPKVIGVLTSGGDSQGMNSVIRSIVRFGLYKKFKVCLIYEGYNGLIKGGDHIKEAKLSTVDHIIYKGGTFIGSSRCKEFREPEGRISAALTLIQNNISKLVVIGGDGSLTGANLLRTEWNSILDNLLKNGKITEEMKSNNSSLNIIGIVGSIDNDFCQTEITTGVDTALHRIVESIDAIATTATSHQRTMIIELMGRNCGYLALVSALATEATFTFIPESPPPEKWHEILSEKIEYERTNCRRLNLILVSEGALDLNGNPITCNDVKKVIAEKTGREVRITILGHIQRGGHASAYDRILGSRLGVAAVDALEESNASTESSVLAVGGNKILKKPLMECVKQTQEVGVAMKNKDWKRCIELRGKSFERNFETFLTIHHKNDEKDNKSTGKAFAVMQVGEPSSGMNASVLAFVRILILNGKTVFGVNNGFEGLVEGKLFQMKWSDVNAWTCESGALLGTSKVPMKINPKHFECIAEQLKKNKINGILVVGGFAGFRMIRELLNGRKAFEKSLPELKIPICLIPATINNNIPGSELSLGTDSTLNKITNLCTDILIANRGISGRVYIVKVKSGYCGYLTVMSALASAAEYCYIFEDNFCENDVRRHAKSIKNKMISDNANRLVIMNGMSELKLKNNRKILDIYNDEGKGVYSAFLVDLGNLQKSLSPSPFDRIFGIKLGVKCADWLKNSSTLKESENAVVIGLTERKYSFSNITELFKNTDFEHRIPNNQWFVKLVDLVNLCS